eukprot:5063056-Pyramimonas_sp.AAC.1
MDFLDHEMIGLCASRNEQSVLESDFESLWPQLEEADFKEIESYVNHKCFKPKLKASCNNENFIGATWVRRWMWK